MSTVIDDLQLIISQAREAYNRRLEGLPDDTSISPLPTPAIEEPPVVSNTLPENSDSVLVSRKTSRFSGAMWYTKIQELSVTLAGLGGIGSYVFYLLSRLHPNTISIYDDDIVEPENMSGQLFRNEDIGRYKVIAAYDLGEHFSDYRDTYSYSTKFDSGCPASDIMICGFDNMAARKTYFESWYNHVMNKSEEERKECLFIDGRLAAEEFQVLCMRGDDTYNINKYKDLFLFSDAEADSTICSYKQTTFMANMIASTMVNLFVNFAANLCKPLIDRALPFYTEFNAETMYFKILS